jgi:hypothetical protein
MEEKKIKLEIIAEMLKVFEHISKWPVEYQKMVQMQMASLFYSLIELEGEIFNREDSHRIAGGEVVFHSVSDKDGNDFWVILKLLNKNAGDDTPIIKLSEKDMPVWYKKGLVN